MSKDNPSTMERIEAGIALLDKKKPTWRQRIDLDGLKLEDGQHCVLGQTYGEYGEGLEKLKLKYWEADDYGFDTSPYGRISNFRVSYKYLTRCWKKALREHGIGVSNRRVVPRGFDGGTKP